MYGNSLAVRKGAECATTPVIVRSRTTGFVQRWAGGAYELLGGAIPLAEKICTARRLAIPDTTTHVERQKVESLG